MLAGQMLKLKQASAVLQVAPKELQNLVQFGVVKPKRMEGTYGFDSGTLLVTRGSRKNVGQFSRDIAHMSILSLYFRILKGQYRRRSRKIGSRVLL